MVNKAFFGCSGAFLLLVFVGIVTNLCRSYADESARTQRLILTEATVVKWEEKWMNNGEDQYPYAQCTVRFTTEDGSEVEGAVLTEFDEPEVGLDEPMSIVYDPVYTNYLKSADAPDEWPKTKYYAINTILMIIVALVFLVVARANPQNSNSKV